SYGRKKLMALSSRWLRSLVSRTAPTTDRASRPSRSRWNPAPLRLERLEDRTAPATNITVVPGLAGDGSLDMFLSATDGTVTTADGGAVPGSISTGALAAVNATTNISI